LNIFPQTKKSLRVFEDLTRTTGVKEEVLMLLLESSIEAAHKIYIDNIKRLNKTNEKLRYTVRKNERESHDARQMLTKKKNLLKAKEQIVASLENKLRQTKKEKAEVTTKLAETKKTDKQGKSKS
jgi:hypothetical protein